GAGGCGAVGRLRGAAAGGCACQHRGGAEKASARNHGLLLVQRAPASPADTAMGFARSSLLLDLPPPAIAALRTTVASQKSRLASMAVIVAAMRWRASASSENASIRIAL